MADSLIRSFPDYLKVPVKLADEQPLPQWRGADGFIYTPGHVVGDDGCIVSATPGELISRGVVWVSDAMLSEAEQHGWKPVGVSADGLSQVAR